MHTTTHVSSLDAVKFCSVARHRNLLLFDFVFVSMKNVHLIIDACLQQIPCCLVFFLLPFIPLGTTWSNSILHVFFICSIFHSILSLYFFILQVIRLQRLIRVCKVRKKGLMYQRQYWGEIALSKVREKGSFFLHFVSWFIHVVNGEISPISQEWAKKRVDFFILLISSTKSNICRFCE